MGDLIDRQQAIADIKRWEGYIDSDMILRIQMSLKRIPAIDPAPHWIPVTERLPEPDGFKNAYLVTVNNGGHRFIAISFFIDSGNAQTWEDDEGIIDSRNVTAWAPLPTPYREEA